jgi:hypothetical protein
MLGGRPSNAALTEPTAALLTSGWPIFGSLYCDLAARLAALEPIRLRLAAVHWQIRLTPSGGVGRELVASSQAHHTQASSCCN